VLEGGIGHMPATDFHHLAIFAALRKHCFLSARCGEICGRRTGDPCGQVTATYLERKGNKAAMRRRLRLRVDKAETPLTVPAFATKVNFALRSTSSSVSAGG
jgi:hypothetical protein